MAKHCSGGEASLQSRIAALASEPEVSKHDGAAGSLYDDEEEEEIVEMTEAELLHLLDQQEPPLLTCSRLFRPRGSWTGLAGARLNVAQEFCRAGPLICAQLESFQANGFVVTDDMLRSEEVKLARAEAASLLQAGMFKAAIGQETIFTDATARNDSLLWLHPGDAACSSPGIDAVMGMLAKVIDQLSGVINLAKGQAEFQLAHYGAAGRYKRHRDALPDSGQECDQRRVTAIVYLNSDWQPADGGFLRMWPPGKPEQRAAELEDEPVPLHGVERALAAVQLGDSCGSSSCEKPGEYARGHSADAEHVSWGHDESGAAVLDVGPLGGRLVMFLSGAVDHEVLPSRADRFAITAWCQ